MAHRHLWNRDARYRIAMLLGPVPLAGVVAVGGFWLAAASLGAVPFPSNQSMPGATSANPRALPSWGKPVAGTPGNNTRGATVGPSSAPIDVTPSAALPKDDRSYTTGWDIAVKPIHFSATMEASEDPVTIGEFTAPGPEFAVAQIAHAANAARPVVGNGSAKLAVRTPGLYTVAFFVDTPMGADAGCKATLHVAGRKVLGYVIISSPTGSSVTTPPAKLNLTPGLYDFSWIFGCWRYDKPVEDGRMIMLVGHPDQAEPTAARPIDFVRPMTAATHRTSAP